MEAKSQLFVLWVAALLRTANGLENAIFVRKSNSTLSSKELKILGFEENHIVNQTCCPAANHSIGQDLRGQAMCRTWRLLSMDLAQGFKAGEWA